jgi:hypothetical protein
MISFENVYAIMLVKARFNVNHIIIAGHIFPTFGSYCYNPGECF